MGFHFYDESPTPPKEQLGRLAVPSVLVKAGIPAIVWGEDALSIVHRVPTGHFDLHILVDASQLESAAQAICDVIPYSRKITDERKIWRDTPLANKKRSHAFNLNTEAILLEHTDPKAVWEKEEPEHIMLHDSSVFHIDVHDGTRTCLNPSPPSRDSVDVRFPTVVACYDALVDTTHETPLPFHHVRFHQWLQTLMGYLTAYTLSDKNDGSPYRIDASGDRIPIDNCWQVLEQVKEANQPTLIRHFLGIPPLGGRESMIEREDIKQEICQRRGLMYQPPTRSRKFKPYSVDCHLPERPLKPRLTPYMIRKNDKHAIDWRPLARYLSIAAKLVR